MNLILHTILFSIVSKFFEGGKFDEGNKQSEFS